jgi:hypothetical protein
VTNSDQAPEHSFSDRRSVVLGHPWFTADGGQVLVGNPVRARIMVAAAGETEGWHQISLTSVEARNLAELLLLAASKV